MRNNEYRVWVTGDEHAKDGFYYINFGDWISEFASRILQKYPTQQFTGIRDSKWNKIYEGDIVANESWYKWRKWTISWVTDKEYCWFVPKDPLGWISYFISWWDMKVIWNIYETFEPLKTKHD